MTSAPRPLRAFTLVETVAATVLLAMAAGVLLPMLAGSGEAARARSAEASVIGADRVARSLASSAGPVVLRIESHDRRIALVSESGEPLASRPLPGGVAIRLTDPNGRTLHALVYDARGRTTDHRVELATDNAVVAWTVSGETGWRSERVLEDAR